MQDQTLKLKLSYHDLFGIFFRSGWAFGGGPGIIAILEDELVRKRQVIPREEFLACYALARIVPAGTSAALAVAFGYRCRGLPGTVVALAAMLLPGVTLTILCTAAYAALRGSSLFEVLSATLVPAALAFILLAALKLGRDVLRPSPDLVLAAGAFGAVLLLQLHPGLLLLGGGLLGLLILRGREGTA